MRKFKMGDKVIINYTGKNSISDKFYWANRFKPGTIKNYDHGLYKLIEFPNHYFPANLLERVEA